MKPFIFSAWKQADLSFLRFLPALVGRITLSAIFTGLGFKTVDMILLPHEPATSSLWGLGQGCKQYQGLHCKAVLSAEDLEPRPVLLVFIFSSSDIFLQELLLCDFQLLNDLGWIQAVVIEWPGWGRPDGLIIPLWTRQLASIVHTFRFALCWSHKSHTQRNGWLLWHMRKHTATRTSQIYSLEMGTSPVCVCCGFSL